MIESSEETCAKFKYTTFETNFSITENKVQESISLQEAFRRYKEAKQVCRWIDLYYSSEVTFSFIFI